MAPACMIVLEVYRQINMRLMTYKDAPAKVRDDGRVKGKALRQRKGEKIHEEPNTPEESRSGNCFFVRLSRILGQKLIKKEEGKEEGCDRWEGKWRGHQEENEQEEVVENWGWEEQEKDEEMKTYCTKGTCAETLYS